MIFEGPSIVTGATGGYTWTISSWGGTAEPPPEPLGALLVPCGPLPTLPSAARVEVS